jgi:hypothetical protein
MAGIRERDKRARIEIFGCGKTVPPLFYVRNMFFLGEGTGPFPSPRKVNGPFRFLGLAPFGN